jgi:hypothetical protein
LLLVTRSCPSGLNVVELNPVLRPIGRATISLAVRGGDGSWCVAGITVPWFNRGRLALVKIRRPEGSEPKYVEAFRDRPRIYPGPEVIRPGAPLVVVEGEFDALLLDQELGSWPPW